MDNATLIACSRMYNTSPVVRDLWADFFNRLAHNSNVDLDVIEHKAPAPLGELWARTDMGVVFMCGYPFSLRSPEDRPVPLASPVPMADWADWAQGQAVYASHIVTRHDSELTLGDLTNVRWGWTVRDSQSGYNALREFLTSLQMSPNGALQTVGPLLNPTGIVDALMAGKIDVGAIDAYGYYLMQRYDPEMVADLRVMTTTKPAPFPLLVASRSQSAPTLEQLQDALMVFHQTEEGKNILSALGLSHFASPDLTALNGLLERKAETDSKLGNAW